MSNKRKGSRLEVDQNGITPYLSPAKKRCPSPTVPLSVQHKTWRPSQVASYLRRQGIDNDVASKFEGTSWESLSCYLSEWKYPVSIVSLWANLNKCTCRLY